MFWIITSLGSSFSLHLEMASERKLWLVVFLLLVATYTQNFAHAEPQVPCLFIFGDSLSDSGNNNNLLTSAKVNYAPYGIDFPNGPTGRFTNGRTGIDIITQLLGFENLIPPFSNTRGFDILKGVNYASGGAGIRVESGTQLGDDISLGLQLSNHRVIASEIATKLGGFDQAQQYLNKCLYYVNIGSNDYINNYFSPQFFPTTSHIYNPEQYARALLQEYSLSIRALHELGARKFALVGLGFIGCTPNEILKHGKNGSSCVVKENVAAFIFNDKLTSLVQQFNQEFSDSKFIYINSTAISSGNPQLAGFKVSNVECCPVGANGQCVPEKTPCQNRNDYIFWDSFHTTEAVNKITATSSYNALDPSFAYPMDISHLAQLQMKKTKINLFRQNA